MASLDQRDGGPVRAIFDLSADAHQHGIHSEIIGVGKIAIADNVLSPDCVHSLSESFPKTYRYSRDLRLWLRKHVNQFDGVVLHGMWQYPQLAAARECVNQGIPYACFPHGMLDLWPIYGQGSWKTFKKVLYWHLSERRIFNHATAVLFTAGREMERAAKVFNLPSQRLLVVPYGVRLDIRRVNQPANSDLIQTPDRKVALFLSRLHPKKNAEFLIRAWAKARLPHNWHLVIAGDGDPTYVRHLNTVTLDLDLDGHVQFVGHVSGEDKFYLLNRADWFLLPSLQENFGIAVLEAVQAHCAVAISDQVYFADYLGVHSEILPLNEANWVTFMCERMIDDNWRREIERNDYEEITRTMSEDTVVQGWCRVLFQLFGPVAGRHSKRGPS